MEPNTGGSSNGEVIFGYGHLNASDRRLKTNIRRVPEQHVQRLFEAVEPQYYDRIGGGKDQLGFIAQDVQAAGKLGESLCKTMSGEEELLALDYQKLSVVLWGVVKSLQKRVEKLEKKRGIEMAEQEAIGLLEQLARDFNVRDPRKLFQIARREFPDRRDLTSARAAAALRGDVARQVLAPKPRSLGKSAAEGPNDRLQADLVDFSQNTRGRNKYGLVVQDVFTREIATKALPDKRAETVTRAAAEIIPDLVQEEGNYVVTTDLGNEFQGLRRRCPEGRCTGKRTPRTAMRRLW